MQAYKINLGFPPMFTGTQSHEESDPFTYSSAHLSVDGFARYQLQHQNASYTPNYTAVTLSMDLPQGKVRRTGMNSPKQQLPDAIYGLPLCVYD